MFTANKALYAEAGAVSLAVRARCSDKPSVSDAKAYMEKVENHSLKQVLANNVLKISPDATARLEDFTKKDEARVVSSEGIESYTMTVSYTPILRGVPANLGHGCKPEPAHESSGSPRRYLCDAIKVVSLTSKTAGTPLVGVRANPNRPLHPLGAAAFLTAGLSSLGGRVIAGAIKGGLKIEIAPVAPMHQIAQQIAEGILVIGAGRALILAQGGPRKIDAGVVRSFQVAQ